MPAWAAQTAVTQISGTQASIGALKTQVNAKLGTVESNRQDHETRVAAMETGLASQSAFTTAWGWNPGDNLGSATAANISSLFTGSGDCLKSDGTKGGCGTGSSLPAWFPSTGPTDGRQILQATGGCSNATYNTQATCEAASATWTPPVYTNTSIISGLIHDDGTADDDLWSAGKITRELSGKQASLGFTAENSALKGTANGYAGLGSDGKVPSSQLPTLGTTYDLPSLADAQAGASTTPYVWSPQRVAQAIAALAPSGGAGEGYYEIDGGSSASLTFTGDIDGGASI